jgi:two-component system phosphate regulon sensor histidine kinase PhoR
MAHHPTSKSSSMAERFAALNRVGIALMSELDEARLLQMITETACSLTDATFAAFTLRPIDEVGQPVVPSEGNLFFLAAVVGVTSEQEELFRRMPLGGEGLLTPIFRHGIPVLVDDILSFAHANTHTTQDEQNSALEALSAVSDEIFTFAHDIALTSELRAIGLPHGHPAVRSFLGVPVLDHAKHVRGGLLLGHTTPGRFTPEDKELLVGLAAQAAVALENARLYHTAQMRAQELNAIFESIADGVTLINNHGTILRENRTARLLREQLQEYPHGKQAIDNMLHTPAQRALNGEKAQGIEVTVADGHDESRQYVVHASPLRIMGSSSGTLQFERSEHTLHNGEAVPTGAVVVWHDVTEARRLLAERRTHAETETRLALLQMILDELPTSIYLVRGLDARLVLANKAATDIWGASWPFNVPMEEFIQQNSIRIFGNDGHELIPEQLATLRAVQKHETIHHHQEVIRHLDGTNLPVLVNAVALDMEVLNILPTHIPGIHSNTEPAAIVVHQDVTALKATERLKDEFIGIAAHELRTPLAVLKGFSQMLIVQTARGKGPELVEWQTEALQGIDQATSRMVELIDDLLDVTRLQARRLEFYIEPNDIVALTRRVLKRQQITTEHHVLSLHAPFEYLVTQIDPQRIEQVLSNLINNAIKYSPDGGSITVTIGADTLNQMAVINIRDSGIGIPKNEQAHVFGRFVRADNARAYGIGGTGLGLYLSREFVEHHGGHIWFESAEGKGSTFSLTLPLVPETSEG